MATLSERDQRLVDRLRRSARATLCWGVLLCGLGIGYSSWAVLRFDPRARVAQHASFDRPLTQLTRLYSRYQMILDLARPATELERILFRGMQANLNFSVGILMTVLRIWMGILVLVMGLVTCTVVMERARLLALIDTLREESLPPSG